MINEDIVQQTAEYIITRGMTGSVLPISFRLLPEVCSMQRKPDISKARDISGRDPGTPPKPDSCG